MDDILVLENFITPKEQSVLKNWIVHDYDSGNLPLLPSANKCYPNCRCRQNIKDGIEEFSAVRDRLIDRFNLQDFPVATPLGHFTMVMDEGASLGKHVDSGSKHLRFNLVVQEPISGSVYIDGKAISLNERDVCGFFPSELLHWSDKIVGRRITCSYGFFVPKNWAFNEK